MKNLLFDFISKYVPIDEFEKQALIDLNIFKTYKKGTILLKEGQLSSDGYFVLSGCIRVFYNVDGEEKTTGFYTEMEGVTPPCVLSSTPSNCYVACVEDSILVVSDANMEESIMQKLPKFETICRILSEELLAKQQINFDEFKTSSPEKRYLNLVQNRPDLIQRIPQYQLASYIGIKPQSLSRLRARLLEKK